MSSMNIYELMATIQKKTIILIIGGCEYSKKVCLNNNTNANDFS